MEKHFAFDTMWTRALTYTLHCSGLWAVLRATQSTGPYLFSSCPLNVCGFVLVKRPFFPPQDGSQEQDRLSLAPAQSITPVLDPWHMACETPVPPLTAVCERWVLHVFALDCTLEVDDFNPSLSCLVWVWAFHVLSSSWVFSPTESYSCPTELSGNWSKGWHWWM